MIGVSKTSRKSVPMTPLMPKLPTLKEAQQALVKEALKRTDREAERLRETIKYKSSKKRCNLYVKGFPDNMTEEDLRINQVAGATQTHQRDPNCFVHNVVRITPASPGRPRPSP